MIDTYSRYILGSQVHARESDEQAREFDAQVFATDPAPLVVHAALGADLDVLKSHSRHKVSYDNPYSEAWFKT